MKLLTLALSFLTFSTLAAGQYAGIQTGTDYRNQTAESNRGQKVGFRAGMLYGYDFGSGIRAEAEVSYREGHKRTQYADAGEDQLAYRRYDSHHSWAYMANLCYDVAQLQVWQLTPYFGAGIGYVQAVEHRKVKWVNETNSEKRRDSGFAYQGLAGIKYPVADQVSLNAQYCYHIPGPHTKNHSVTVGLVKAF